MNMIIQALSRIKAAHSTAGFTMIELLIVISIIGILAVAVLSAISPVEQINRGRDTGSQSDAEQLLSAIDRFHAYQGYYPWFVKPDSTTALGWTKVDATWKDDHATSKCPVYEKLSTATTTGCNGSNELKSTFFSRIFASGYNSLYASRKTGQGSSVYICFLPQSAAFAKKAQDRCGTSGNGLPTDVSDAAKAEICDDTDKQYMYCLP